MKEQIKAKHLVKGLQLVKVFYKANAFFLIIFILFSFDKDNCNITFYNTNIKLLTLVLLNITHSITMSSLQHTKLQSLQILQKLRYMKFIENGLIQSTKVCKILPFSKEKFLLARGDRYVFF